MSALIAKVVLTLFSVMVITSSALAQSDLSAKANSLQPQPAVAAGESDRSRDGLAGPVRKVRTEIAKVSVLAGKLIEDRRVLLEVAAYDLKGNKTQNQYFPVAGSTLTGKETYKYDEKGNISEMIMVNDDGSLLNKEIYQYDYDFVGNWTRMTTSVAVVDSGKVTFEPTEVTHRSIMYYLDDNIAKMVQPGSQPSINQAGSPTTVSDSEVKAPPASRQLSEPKESASQKPVPLPASESATEKLSAVNSVEVKNVATSANGDREPRVTIDAEPPPSPGSKPLTKPMSGGVLNGKALNLPMPPYPDAAKRMRTSGVVVVEVVVDETGKVISAQASNGPLGLRDAAVQAALKARFSPTKLSGQPVKVSGVISYKFSLTL